MPGIFGIFSKTDKTLLSGLSDRMISSMKHSPNMRVDRIVDEKDGIMVGRISLGVFNVIEQPVKDRANTCWIVFHGELYNNPVQLSDPEYVLQLYFEKGDKCAHALKGIFHFMIYDTRTCSVSLFSDKFGLQPLYYALLPDGIVFSGEVKALLQEKRISKEPDFQSFADFYHYGQVLGQKTLFKDIKLLQPGAILTYNLRNAKISQRKYFYLEDLFAEKGVYSSTVSPDEVVSSLIKSVHERKSGKDMLGLSLSGGLDSRGILAGLGREAEDVHTYTLGLPGCADQQIAWKMSQIAGTRHEFIELDQNYLQNFYGMAEGMINLSDGMYHPYESTEMLALEYFKRAPFKILLRGHGGEIAKAALAYPVMVKPEVYSYQNGESILDYIFKLTNLVIRDIEPEKIFTTSLFAKMKDAARASLDESCRNISHVLAPADTCIYYYINEHIRRQVVSSLEIFRTQIEVRMPYIDEDYMNLLLKLPVSQRNSGEIHYRLVRRCMPELIKITNSNTGAPLDAGQLRLFLTDKFNSVMKRLGIKGFRHYTEFQEWQRKNFRDTTESIIFSEKLQDRDIYRTNYIKTVFEKHISGKRNYAHLLGTMVGIELWYRNFVD